MIENNIEISLKKATNLTPSEFISSAIKGGWNKTEDTVDVQINKSGGIACFKGELPFYPYTIEAILLDPNAWRAVGKSENWEEIDGNNCGGCETCARVFGTEDQKDEWLENLHRFINYLAEETNNNT